MGLSGVKKRSKLSQDPNNTAWSKSTTTFGHKILSKQGWKPGDYLGAENATHSDHYTAANASHIRVLLREDNLGLGAKIGRGNAETFGLSMFSGLLGRLNGKSDEEVQKQQDNVRNAELRTYTGQKYGFMNFVSGGLLVGDKMEPPKSKTVVMTKERAAVEVPSKKRKLEDEDIVAPAKTKKQKADKLGSNASGDGVESKRSKKASKHGEPDGTSDSDSSDSETAIKVQEKKQKKERRKEIEAVKSAKPPRDDEKARLKEEKRARKEERRKRKEEKRSKKAAKESQTLESAQTSAVTSETDGAATPPLLQVYGGRQAVRQRYIQQKRLASMDPKALKEIFMMQAKATA